MSGSFTTTFVDNGSAAVDNAGNGSFTVTFSDDGTSTVAFLDDSFRFLETPRPLIVQSAGTTIGTRDTINFVSGATVTDNVGSTRVDITIATAANMVGDSGSGGTAGLVPGPTAGYAAAGRLLRADATWASFDKQVVCKPRMNPPLAGSGQLLSARAYAVYLGIFPDDRLIKYVRFQVVTFAGTGAQTAEVALASSPTAPAYAAQTLTILVADGTVDSLLTTGVKKNANGFNSGSGYTVARDTHLWAVVRVAMASTQPYLGICDHQELSGSSMFAAGASALAAAQTIAFSIQTATAPYVMATGA
jgi:hypothetical protein